MRTERKSVANKTPEQTTYKPRHFPRFRSPGKLTVNLYYTRDIKVRATGYRQKSTECSEILTRSQALYTFIHLLLNNIVKLITDASSRRREERTVKMNLDVFLITSKT